MEGRVKLFTASGTFRGQEGVVVERTRDGARVLLDDGDTLFFTRGEMVPLESEHHIGGAE